MNAKQAALRAALLVILPAFILRDQIIALGISFSIARRVWREAGE